MVMVLLSGLKGVRSSQFRNRFQEKFKDTVLRVF